MPPDGWKRPEWDSNATDDVVFRWGASTLDSAYPSELTHKFYGQLVTQAEWERMVNEHARKGIDQLPEPEPPKAPVIIAKRYNRQQPRWSAERWRSTT